MSKQDIEKCIQDSVEDYFNDLQGEIPHSLYNMIIGAAEKPLLEVVMRHARQNQSLAAQWLGINRNTLRKKLLHHQLIRHVQSSQPPQH